VIAMGVAVDPKAAALLLELLSRRKWAPVVLGVLDEAEEPLRFGEVQRRIEQISAHILNHTLTSLCRDGLVVRRAYDERPARVEYSVSELGRSFCQAFDGLLVWAGRHAADVEAARQRFDEQQ
jgi:DNA-binding HxlR family transcriptional regulator